VIVGMAQDAERLLAPFFCSAEEERIAVLHLGAGRALIGVTLEAAGAEAEVELPVEQILRSATRLGACGLIVAHNHPSGNPEPSAADKMATRALQRGGAAVGIRLYDHLIFGGDRWRSFAALELL
jgi:DNA repair protein RadC